MQSQITAKSINKAITKRRKSFIKSLKKTTKSPTRKNTHKLSTSLKRLLVVDNVVRQLYGENIIPASLMQKNKRFRKTLAAIRDNDELRVKLKKLKLKNNYLNYTIKQLEIQRAKLELKIIRECVKLNKLDFSEYFRKTSTSKIFQTEPLLSIQDFLQELLSKIWILHEQAIINSDDIFLHKLRIRYKNFRYSYELLAPLISNLDNEANKSLRTIQIVLGEAHDWLVIKQRIQRIDEPTEHTGKQPLVTTISRKLNKSNKYARKYILQKWPKILKLSLFNQSKE